jgi:hypothetical protein
MEQDDGMDFFPWAQALEAGGEFGADLGFFRFAGHHNT